MRRLNSNVDRTEAVKGRRDDTRLVISLTDLNGKLKVGEYGHPVDWDNSNDIRSLNRWRSQYLR